MKTEEMREKGFTDEQIKYVMAENGKDISKAQKETERLTEELNNWKTKAENAETALKNFEGINPEEIKTQLNEYKTRAEEVEKVYKQQIYERDYEKALTEQLEQVKFSSNFAKEAIISKVKAKNLPLNEGKILGLGDLIEQFKEADKSAFIDEAQAEANASAAKFTLPTPNSTAPTMTKAEIMAIKDRDERLAAIAKHKELFT